MSANCAMAVQSLVARLMIELNGGGDLTVMDYPAERKKIDIGDYYSCFDRFRAATGWRPTVEAEAAIAAMLAAAVGKARIVIELKDGDPDALAIATREAIASNPGVDVGVISFIPDVVRAVRQAIQIGRAHV